MDAGARPPIAAIASGEGPAGIGVIRISGDQALLVARRCLRGFPEAASPRRLYRSLLIDALGEPLDEVLVAHFPSPRSYTGEEVVEIQGHGGRAILRASLGALLAAGATLAKPGEFTRRAVTNGRIDLVEAEGLAALLEAEESDDLLAARRALGELGPELRRLYADAVAALAEARGAHDYPLETQGELLEWTGTARGLAGRCRQLAGSRPFEAGALEGSRVLLLGPPNAGKSSLFNALAGEERALVDGAPGTTRDLVRAAVRLGGRRVTLIDSAGIREASGLEGAGVERALAAARAVDLVLWVEDVSAAPAELPVESAILVLSKTDLAFHPGRGETAPGALLVSAKEGRGVAELREEIERRLPRAPGAASARQRELLLAAAKGMEDSEAEEAVLAEALQEAVEQLGRLVGASDGLGEAAEAVFERFCLGK